MLVVRWFIKNSKMPPLRRQTTAANRVIDRIPIVHLVSCNLDRTYHIQKEVPIAGDCPGAPPAIVVAI